MASHLTGGLFTLPPQSEQSRAAAFAKSKMRGMYAAEPGTGPNGETCKSCKNIVRRKWDKVYLKCGLTKANWTKGPGTDIKAGSPACSKWERGE